MFSYTIPLWLQRLIPSLTWKVNSRQQEVYFTFDDGPHPDLTTWVIEQLAVYNAKATFFCVGDNVVKFPKTYEMILQNGHSTGNHTFNHLNGWHTPNAAYFENIEKCNAVMHSTLFRPPYGKITPNQIRHLKPSYKIIMWDILTRDYNNNLSPDEILSQVKPRIKPGSIIVLHDSLKAEKNMKAILPELLKYCVEKGFTFGKF